MCSLALHLLARTALNRFLPRRWLARVPRHDRIYLPEMLVSSVHGLFVGLCSFLVVFRRRAFQRDIFLYPLPEILDQMFAASAGYSLHDMSVMLCHGEPMSMWLHHVAMAYGCFFIQVYRQAPFFCCLFQLSELTVLPTNIMWYIQKFSSSKTSSNGQKLLLSRLAFLRAGFYLAFRAWLGPWAVFHVLRTHGAGPFWRRFSRLPFIVSVGNSANVSFLSAMNLLWTKQALDRLHKQRRQP